MTTLVVGVGSDLRSDDRAGREVAERVAARGLPDVVVESVHQLVPELADRIVGCDRVVFVDASTTATTPTLRPVVPTRAGQHATSHVASPAVLLGLVQLLGGDAPDAHVLSVPAVDWSLGEQLSRRTADAVDVAVQLIVDLVTGPA